MEKRQDLQPLFSYFRVEGDIGLIASCLFPFSQLGRRSVMINGMHDNFLPRLSKDGEGFFLKVAQLPPGVFDVGAGTGQLFCTQMHGDDIPGDIPSSNPAGGI